MNEIFLILSILATCYLLSFNILLLFSILVSRPSKMASESNDGSTAAAESTSVMADGSTDTASDAVTDEERLRQEAARRLERRRRKMMSPEERLAKITGRPVAASPSPDTSPTVQMPGDWHSFVTISVVMRSYF